MALVPKQHTHITGYTRNAAATIEPGQVVTVNGTGEVILCHRGVTNDCIGLAGDTQGSVSGYDPRTGFRNRASDYGDETVASGKMSVYFGPGEFYVDIDTTGTDTDRVIQNGSTLTPGTLLYVSATNAGQLSSASSGASVAQVIAGSDEIVEGTPNRYLQTGIPNEFTPSGDSDNPRSFVLIRWFGTPC